MLGLVKDIIRRIKIEYLRCKAKRTLMLRLPKRVLIIAPHPDDEVLGCGGLITRLSAQDNPPHVVILTRGEGSHLDCCKIPKSTIIAKRHNLTLNASKIIGLTDSHIHYLDFKDGHISDDMNSDRATDLERLVSETCPDAIFVPHWGEGWPDHVYAARMVRDIAPNDVEIYEYCVWMWYYNVWKLDWKNACQLKMTNDEHQRKLAAIKAYVKPCAPCGKPWSGVLPKLFLEANHWDHELYFKAK